ncbi:MAG: hypothetical protein SVW57_12895 [Thermodesulfobacteriota bacterium]|nr:hypothetical protein [Thermodesulfobacteriota bacterium]
MQYETVETGSIDISDDRFIVSYFNSLELLGASLKKVGQIYPVILRENLTKRGFTLVAGYKRYLVLKDSQGFVNALIYKQCELKDLDALFLSLNDNITSRGLNEVEKSSVLHKLKNYYHISDDDLISNILPLLNISPHKNTLDLYMRVNDLDSEIKHALAFEGLPMKVALKLLEFEKEERIFLFSVVRRLKMGMNKATEFLELSEDILQRDQISIQTLWDKIAAQGICEDYRLSNPQKGDEICVRLKRIRFPRLSIKEDTFFEYIRALKLPPHMKLIPPKYFEGTTFKVKFAFENTSELKGAVDKLTEVAESSEIERIVDLV